VDRLQDRGRLRHPANPAFALTDGYIDLKFLPEIGLRGGQYKQPFSLEELTSDLFIDTIERSMVNELVPSRDVGVMLQGQLFDRILGYSVAVFNGAGINASDTNNEKNVAARFTVAPFRNTDNYWLKGLNIGFGGTWGDEDNNLSARGRTVARTSNRFQFFAQQPTRGDRYRWSADLAWLVGPASLKFEYNQQIDQRKKLGAGGRDLDDIRATGWYVTLTYLLTGENSVLNGPVIPRHPLSPFASKIGPGAWKRSHATLSSSSHRTIPLTSSTATSTTASPAAAARPRMGPSRSPRGSTGT
jgi:phosphate-selective porin OprO and OprP